MNQLNAEINADHNMVDLNQDLPHKQDAANPQDNQPPARLNIVIARAATWRHREAIVTVVRHHANRFSIQTVNGTTLITLNNAEKHAAVLAALSDSADIPNELFSAGAGPAAGAGTVFRYIVTEFIKPALIALEGSLKRGLARSLADQTGAQANQLKVVQLLEDAAVVLVKNHVADQAVQAVGDRHDPSTRIAFTWIRYRRPNFCGNCGRTGCEAPCTRRAKCMKCARGGNTTSECRSNSVRSFRCTGPNGRKRGDEHRADDRGCPAMIRKCVADPTICNPVAGN